jgi:hypothetical protein
MGTNLANLSDHTDSLVAGDQREFGNEFTLVDVLVALSAPCFTNVVEAMSNHQIYSHEVSYTMRLYQESTIRQPYGNWGKTYRFHTHRRP